MTDQPASFKETFMLTVFPFMVACALAYAIWHYTREQAIIRNGGNSTWHIDDSWFVDHSELKWK